jgi:hypothetical protein
MSYLEFAQGQIAPFYGLFVISPSGQPTNVPDATIEILGPAANVVLAATPMLTTGRTGLYHYDWQIPNSLATGSYTAIITGTILGTPTAMTQTVAVIPGGTTPNLMSSTRATDLVTYLEVYLECPQRVPVYNDLAFRSADLTSYKFKWANWNLSNPDVRINGRQTLPTDAMFPYNIDYNAGLVRFNTPLLDTDRVTATYNFRMFTESELLRFISDAISEINMEAPFSYYTLDNFPLELVGAVMAGARKNAMMQLMLCIQFQDTATIFGKEGKKDAYNAFKDIKENSEKAFTEMRKQIKKRLPRIAMVSTPEYTLPGGRARWFRYLFNSGLG